jgi:hypothetical protein
METTMLDVFKSRLPEGLTIAKATKRGGNYKLVLEYDGIQQPASLSTTCAPKQENIYCDFAIATAMMSIALKRTDLELCKQWKAFQNALFNKPEEAPNINTILQQLLNELESKNIKALLKKITDAYNDNNIPDKARNTLGFITADYETLLSSIHASKDQIERLSK